VGRKKVSKFRRDPSLIVEKGNMIGSKKRIVQLWGREFHLVKRGFSQDQVAAFVTELINQNNALVKKTERLTFLESLAEKTVAEADQLAVDIRSKAREEANNILQAAEKEAAQIKVNAEGEAKQLLLKSRERLKDEMKEKVTEISQRLRSHVEEAIGAVWPQEPVPTISEKPAQQHVFVPKQSEKIAEPLADKTTPSCYEGKVDLEIMPPVDLARFMELRRRLQCIPDLKIMQVTSSLKNGCRISSLVIRPIPLLDVLRRIPEVREVVAPEDSQQVEASDRRVLITLVSTDQA
jgi:vacuolar-type H+-ATPase subunit H